MLRVQKSMRRVWVVMKATEAEALRKRAMVERSSGSRGPRGVTARCWARATGRSPGTARSRPTEMRAPRTTPTPRPAQSHGRHGEEVVIAVTPWSLDHSVFSLRSNRPPIPKGARERIECQGDDGAEGTRLRNPAPARALAPEDAFSQRVDRPHPGRAGGGFRGRLGGRGDIEPQGPPLGPLLLFPQGRERPDPGRGLEERRPTDQVPPPRRHEGGSPGIGARLPAPRR